jgi:hypothetical protein
VARLLPQAAEGDGEYAPSEDSSTSSADEEVWEDPPPPDRSPADTAAAPPKKKGSRAQAAAHAMRIQLQASQAAAAGVQPEATVEFFNKYDDRAGTILGRCEHTPETCYGCSANITGLLTTSGNEKIRVMVEDWYSNVSTLTEEMSALKMVEFFEEHIRKPHNRIAQEEGREQIAAWHPYAAYTHMRLKLTQIIYQQKRARELALLADSALSECWTRIRDASGKVTERLNPEGVELYMKITGHEDRIIMKSSNRVFLDQPSMEQTVRRAAGSIIHSGRKADSLYKSILDD